MSSQQLIGSNILKPITVASLGVLLTLLGMFGNAIVVMTGIPGMGGVINGFIGPLMYAFCCLLIRKFGAVTFMGLVYGIVSLPLPNLGMPGFLPKILITVVAGLATDIAYRVVKQHEKVAAIVAGIVAAYSTGLLLVAVGLLFKLPGIEKYITLFPKLLIAGLPMGLLGGYSAYLIFEKLKNTNVVKRISFSKYKS